MNRLRDDAGDDPATERGLALLRAASPTPPMPELKRRVWAALEQRTRTRTPGLSAGLFGMTGLKVFAMSVTIMSLAGTAGAVITGRWIVPVLERAASSAAPVTGPRAPSTRPEKSR